MHRNAGENEDGKSGRSGGPDMGNSPSQLLPCGRMAALRHASSRAVPELAALPAAGGGNGQSEREMNRSKKIGKKDGRQSKKDELAPKGSVGTSKSEEMAAAAATPAASPKGAPVAGYYLGDRKLDEAVGGFCRASRARAHGRFEALVQDAAELARLVCELDGGKFEGLKRANSTDPYNIVAGHDDCPVGAKQLRRLATFHAAYEAITALGERPPELGVTAYSVTQPIEDISVRLGLLRRVESEGLSIRELIDFVDELVPKKTKERGPFDWLKALQGVIGRTYNVLAEVDAEMLKLHACLDAETAKHLSRLQGKIGDLLLRVKA